LGYTQLRNAQLQHLLHQRFLPRYIPWAVIHRRLCLLMEDYRYFLHLKMHCPCFHLHQRHHFHT
jgi:hypothetical protein